MRILALISMSLTAFAQTPLIGVNSAAAELPAGARDVIVSITLDPSPAGGDLLAVMLATEGINIRIELPDGRVMTKDSATTAGYTWEIAGQGQGDELMFPGLQGKENHILLLPPKAPSGKYQIHADASGLKEDSALVVQFLPLGNGPAGSSSRDTVRIALTSTEIFHYAGERVQLLAGVFEGNRGVNGAALTCEAVRVDESGMPQGSPVPVKFQPSGKGSDGSYTAEFPATSAGNYEVSLRVQGHYASGEEFERVAGTSIKIDIRRATIVSVSERPIDEDGNGLIDRIELTARVKVELAGVYNLTVNLTAADGKYMQAYGKAELAVGEGRITANVDRYSLAHVGAGGPYKISARLFRQETNTDGFASLLENAGVTRPYRQASFDRGALYFAGKVKAIPQSATGRRPFEKLAIQLDVFTPGGFCFWASSLRSEKEDVGSAQKNGNLPKGPAQVTLIFDGYTISDAADGKPLTLHDVHINCGTLGATLEHSVALPLFAAHTFVKAAPNFDIWTQPSFRLRRGEGTPMDLQIRPQGGFNEPLEIAMDDLPKGISVRNFPTSTAARRLGGVPYYLTVAPDAPPGEFRITFRAKYKTIERTAQLTLFVDP